MEKNSSEGNHGVSDPPIICVPLDGPSTSTFLLFEFEKLFGKEDITSR